MDPSVTGSETQSRASAADHGTSQSGRGCEQNGRASGSWMTEFMSQFRQQYDPRSALRAIVSIPAFHEPVIDGVRAIAICWVIAVHLILYQTGYFPREGITLFNLPWLHFVARGDMGVDLFFVISGYLIGTLLLGEASKTGTLRLRRFYLRRFLRLIPVYVVAMVLSLYFLHGFHATKIWANLLYINNFLPINQQYMPWCWSLAIEEQFYLLLPVVVLLLMRMRRGRWSFMGLLLVLAGVIRWIIIRRHGILPPFTDMPGMPTYDRRLTLEYQNLYSRYGALLNWSDGRLCDDIS